MAVPGAAGSFGNHSGLGDPVGVAVPASRLHAARCLLPVRPDEACGAQKPRLPRPKRLVYAGLMLDEKDFRNKADAAFEDLKRRLLTAGDEHGFDVEGESGKLEVIFEEPEEAKFVVSPNTPVREIWISALSTSFKLSWSAARNAFILEKTGEDLHAVMGRVISQQLGTQVTL
jgi:iron donor protein CyaY